MILRETPERAIGTYTWSSAFAVSRVLDACENTLEPILGKLQGMNVVELGAGTGFCGMTAALQQANAIVTDLPGDIIRNTQESVNLNNDAIQKYGGYVRVDTLEWGNDGQAETVLAGLNGSLHLIVAADVVYKDTLFDKLLHTIEMLVSYSTEEAYFLLGYLERDRKEVTFFEKLYSLGFQVVRFWGHSPASLSKFISSKGATEQILGEASLLNTEDLSSTTINRLQKCLIESNDKSCVLLFKYQGKHGYS